MCARTYSEDLFYKGVAQYQHEKFQAAQDLWETVCECVSTPALLPYAQFGLGLIALEQKKYKKAIYLFSIASIKIRTCLETASASEGMDPLFSISQLQGLFIKTSYFLSISYYFMQQWDLAKASLVQAMDELKQFSKIEFDKLLFSFQTDSILEQHGLWPELHQFANEHLLILLGLIHTRLQHYREAIGLFKVLQIQLASSLRIRCLYQLGILEYSLIHFDLAQGFFSEVQKESSADNPISDEIIQLSILLCQFYQSQTQASLFTSFGLSETYFFECAYFYSRDVMEIVSQIFYDKKNQSEGERKKVETLLFWVTYSEPDFGLAHYNLGLTQYHLKNYSDALVSLKLAYAYNRELVQALYYIGLSLKSLGSYDEAESYFLKIIQIQKNFDICYNIGDFYFEQQKWEKAKAFFTQALSYQNDFQRSTCDVQRATFENQFGLSIYSKLARCLIETDSSSDEITHSLNQIETLSGVSVSLHHLWAQYYFKTKAYFQARERLKQALETDRFYMPSARLFMFVSQKFREQCNWTYYEEDSHYIIQLTKDYLDHGLESPLDPQIANALIEDIELQGRIASSGSIHFYKEFQEVLQDSLIHIEDYKKTGRRLRIGWLSGSCNGHIVGTLSCGLLQYFDHTQFETYVYHYGMTDESKAYYLFKATSDHFLDVGTWHQRDIMTRIIQDKIDILIETAVFTGYPSPEGENYRPSICRFRLAPVQLYYLDFCGNLDFPNIDYMICNSYLTASAEHLYKTSSLYLPCAYGSSFPALHLPVKGVFRKDYQIPSDAFVYISMNRSYKIEPFIFKLWMDILRQIPNSILCLLKCSEEMEPNLKAEAVRQGVDPTRLYFFKERSMDEYLGFYQLCDLCLDPYIYNGHSTTLYALWMDCLTLTYPGTTWARRASGSLLEYVSLPELIAQTPEAYVETACRLAQNPDQLKALKEKFLQNKHKLFDTQLWVQYFEKGLLMAWDRFLKGELPCNLLVESGSAVQRATCDV